MKHRHPRIKILVLTLLLLGCSALLAMGTYAAYTSYDYVKRVVAARTREDGGALRFSSNYLFPLAENGSSYGERTIGVTNMSDDLLIQFTVCNYPQGNTASFNDNDISYSVTVTPPSETNVKVDSKTGELKGGKPSSNLHTITVPKDDIEAVSKGYISVLVTPEDASKYATQNYQLAANLKIVLADVTSTGWTGEIMLNGTLSEKNDAINYYIHGTEECDMVLSWGPKVALGKWSEKSLNVISPGSNSVTIHVGGPGQPTSYYLQFYRTAPAESGENLGISLKKS